MALLRITKKYISLVSDEKRRLNFASFKKRAFELSSALPTIALILLRTPNFLTGNLTLISGKY